MRSARAESVEPERYPIRGTFAGCWARAETVVSNKVVSNPTKILYIVFAPAFFATTCALLYCLTSHRMTLSARANRLGGIVRPICFAVFRLITRLKLPRLLHRQVGGLGASQDFVTVGGRAAKRFGRIRALAHEAAGCDILGANVGAGNCHRTTFAARVSTFGGIVTPICLAVFKLNASSTSSTVSTRRSPGGVPARTFCTYLAERRPISK